MHTGRFEHLAYILSAIVLVGAFCAYRDFDVGRRSAFTTESWCHVDGTQSEDDLVVQVTCHESGGSILPALPVAVGLGSPFDPLDPLVAEAVTDSSGRAGFRIPRL